MTHTAGLFHFSPRPVAVVILSLLMVIGCVSCTAPTNQNAVIRQSADPSGFLGAALPEPYLMPDAVLTDTSGGSFNLRTTPSAPVTLVFFGYTSCPDVCIAVLSDVATALGRMDAAARSQIQVVFITTDPSRDTPKRVRAYLDRFDPSFIGLTGDLGTIKSVGKRIGVEIEGMHKLPSGGYEVGHGAQVIGFDKARKGVVLWTPSTPIGDLKHDFELLVAKQR
ncbi:MAG: Cytochrome oxidase biogenesis protein Sco1/SenC/PrrC, thiol-disulfide reductase involved in Cu(I) insertion into CoxII Cu(A) center [uncultured Propionibacteriaceae bacterium]|uniref:Cytochrome oxidase biogenesis protein Sco1/SenC/PrrC, thiol-disulfide reductase involved in Cu(I) insertion into CoxII Cu(A) center n=1 Tax=uncultured Propionibacteriaceae bacterium TaxID=257457 RepID=A0A6J4PDK2_9ACTN|nr:MAG: Cytochrome oxidase biogenesis protein Sco1/SenC/PrrC, thiol-disulfide reductase involved in Cu(I) insertion into CoxII Cu(A) center [uncultured Propionibacteriaceae bacterium]